MRLKAVEWALLAGLAAVDVYIGLKLPWWSFCVPAFLVGWLIATRPVRVVTLAAVLAWLGMALYFDLPTGFRLSMRIAGVMSLPGFPLAYLATLGLVATLAALAAAAGANLRAIILRAH